MHSRSSRAWRTLCALCAARRHLSTPCRPPQLALLAMMRQPGRGVQEQGGQRRWLVLLTSPHAATISLAGCASQLSRDRSSNRRTMSSAFTTRWGTRSLCWQCACNATPALCRVVLGLSFLAADWVPRGALFFQFHTSSNEPSTDPVVTWHQGGPGGSSLYGSYTEMGCGARHPPADARPRRVSSPCRGGFLSGFRSLLPVACQSFFACAVGAADPTRPAAHRRRGRLQLLPGRLERDARQPVFLEFGRKHAVPRVPCWLRRPDRLLLLQQSWQTGLCGNLAPQASPRPRRLPLPRTPPPALRRHTHTLVFPRNFLRASPRRVIRCRLRRCWHLCPV